jgi:hypothetical protein
MDYLDDECGDDLYPSLDTCLECGQPMARHTAHVCEEDVC